MPLLIIIAVIAASRRSAGEIEADVRSAIPRAHVFTHLEPLGDPRSDDDVLLSRRE